MLDMEKTVSELVRKGVTVRFHKENLTFNSQTNDSMGKLLFQILGAFAEFERNLIRERQAEGIAFARAKGKNFGRPPKLTEEQKKQMHQDWQNKTETRETISSLAKKFNVSRATVHNVVSSSARPTG